MKFRNKKLNIIIRKGLALTLAVSMFGGLLPALPAKAADYTVDIDDAVITDYNTSYTYAKNDMFTTELDENKCLRIMYNKLSFFVENVER